MFRSPGFASSIWSCHSTSAFCPDSSALAPPGPISHQAPLSCLHAFIPCDLLHFSSVLCCFTFSRVLLNTIIPVLLRHCAFHYTPLRDGYSSSTRRGARTHNSRRFLWEKNTLFGGQIRRWNIWFTSSSVELWYCIFFEITHHSNFYLQTFLVFRVEVLQLFSFSNFTS